MKEILIGIGTLNIGGTEKHVVDIIKSFNRKKNLKFHYSFYGRMERT